MRWGRRNYPAMAVMLLVVALMFAGCGGRGRDGASGAVASEPEEQAEDAVPTMPAAQFAQPTTMIEAETETETGAETEAAEAETAGTEAEDTETEDTDAAEPAGAALSAEAARGLELYTTRGCGDCHGAAAEGMDGEGPALAGTALTLDEFTDLLRTGGEIGPDHLYGPMTISPSGVDAVYAWLQALPVE